MFGLQTDVCLSTDMHAYVKDPTSTWKSLVRSNKEGLGKASEAALDQRFNFLVTQLALSNRAK